MLIIRSTEELMRALDMPLHPILKTLLTLRRDQLMADGICEIGEIARFHVVRPDDSIDIIEAELGFPIMTNLVDGAHYGEPDFEPSWEYVIDHGGWFEAVYILDDSGFGHVLLIEDCDGVDADLRALCREYCNNEREPGRCEGSDLS